MKTLIAGGKGMLGRTLCEAFKSGEVVVADLPECDITDRSSIAAFSADGEPVKVVNDQFGNPTSAEAVVEAIRFIHSN